MNFFKNKVFGMVLALICGGMFLSNSVDAATRFEVGSGNSCKVTISKDILKNGRAYPKATKYAKISLGLTQLPSKVKISLYDENNNFLSSWIAGHGYTFQLGNDHKGYVIKVDKYKQYAWTGNQVYLTRRSYCSIL